MSPSSETPDPPLWRELCSAAVAIALLALGLLLGVGVWVTLNVSFTLSEPMRNMDPRVQFMFIPVFAACLFVPSAFVSNVLYLMGWTLPGHAVWLVLGLGYSLLGSCLVLAWWMPMAWAAGLVLGACMLAVWCVYRTFGTKA